MKRTIIVRHVVTCLFAMLCCSRVHAIDGRFHLGLWLGIDVADGEPANDIPGLGFQIRYALDDDWALGAGIGRTEYDFEAPAAILAIPQDLSMEPIDALAEASTFSAWAERAFAPGDGAVAWFAGAALGAASVDVPVAAGPRADGGQFDIHTDVRTEVILTGFAGVRRALGQRWFAEFRVHANQHFADWKMLDRVSGATGTIEDYLSFGGRLALGVRW